MILKLRRQRKGSMNRIDNDQAEGIIETEVKMEVEGEESIQGSEDI